MSMPMTRRIRASIIAMTKGAAGRHDTYGSARAAAATERATGSSAGGGGRVAEAASC